MTEAPIIPLRDARPARPLAERDDDELMLLVRAGAADAMAVVVGRYHARLVSFCAKRTGDLAAAEELVQEVFLRLWRRRADYRSEGKLAVLLYTMARNLCANHARWWHRRARWFDPAPADDATATAPGEGHVEALLARERRREVEVAMHALPVKLREAVVLRFEHELAYEQIAAIVSANESTVRSRVHLGLQQLRARLEPGGSR